MIDLSPSWAWAAQHFIDEPVGISFTLEWLVGLLAIIGGGALVVKLLLLRRKK